PAREFVVQRLRGLFGEKAPTDVVEAVLAAGGDDIVDWSARIAALCALRERPDFAPLAATFKRVANILKGEAPAAGASEALLREPAERALFAEVVGVRTRAAATRDYVALLAQLATLKPAVDAFFDDVLVMDEDPDVRGNRLALLGSIDAMFRRVADFRQIVV
ncbi:MAG: DALR anticodon-binding domain-containing protein, partial [Myxococcota bacterium]